MPKVRIGDSGSVEIKKSRSVERLRAVSAAKGRIFISPCRLGSCRFLVFRLFAWLDREDSEAGVTESCHDADFFFGDRCLRDFFQALLALVHGVVEKGIVLLKVGAGNEHLRFAAELDVVDRRDNSYQRLKTRPLAALEFCRHG